MTEAEWLASTDSEATVTFLSGRARNRKLRLFGVACCWLCEALHRNAASCRRLELIERYADGEESDADLQATSVDAWVVASQYSPAGPMGPEFGSAEWWQMDELEGAFEAVALLSAQPTPGEPLVSLVADAIMRLERFVSYEYRLRPLLHDIFGNPFHPVTFDTAWRTDTAVSLAQQMYDSRDFSAMPILADALQDAGCDSEDILSHCREAGQVHVRGCWVVDLVLGKQ